MIVRQRVLSELSQSSFKAGVAKSDEEFVVRFNWRQTLARKRPTIVVSLLTVAAAGIFGSEYLESKLPVALVNRWPILDSRRVPALEYISNEYSRNKATNQKFLQKAWAIRELWKPWAINHRYELKQMLCSGPQDQTALVQVYNVLPTTPPGSDPIHGYKASLFTQFTWQPGGRTYPIPVGKSFNDYKQHSSTRRIIDDFSEWHDIELSRSMMFGSTCFKIWASGRITETWQDTWYSYTQGIFVGPPQTREIRPPYKELTR